MMEKSNYKMQDGREVMIGPLTIEDCEYNGNYENMYQWLHQVNMFLTREFNEHDLEQNKKQFYELRFELRKD